MDKFRLIIVAAMVVSSAIASPAKKNGERAIKSAAWGHHYYADYYEVSPVRNPATAVSGFAEYDESNRPTHRVGYDASGESTDDEYDESGETTDDVQYDKPRGFTHRIRNDKPRGFTLRVDYDKPSGSTHRVQYDKPRGSSHRVQYDKPRGSSHRVQYDKSRESTHRVQYNKPRGSTHRVQYDKPRGSTRPADNDEYDESDDDVDSDDHAKFDDDDESDDHAKSNDDAESDDNAESYDDVDSDESGETGGSREPVAPAPSTESGKGSIKWSHNDRLFNGSLYYKHKSSNRYGSGWGYHLDWDKRKGAFSASLKIPFFGFSIVGTKSITRSPGLLRWLR